MPLHNFGKVADNLYRGAQPREYEGFSTLRKMGITDVIKLCTNDEINDAKEQSMFNGTVHLLPLPPLIRPHIADQVISIARKIEMLRTNTGVFFGCVHGRDRTGLVAGAWRIIFQDWDVEAVMAEHDAFSSTHPILNWVLDHTADAQDVQTLREIFAKIKG